MGAIGLALVLGCSGVGSDPVEVPTIDAPSPGPVAVPSPRRSVGPDEVCDLSAWVADPDPRGLNVRETPDGKGKVVAVLPWDADQPSVVSLSGWKGDWVKIAGATGPDGEAIGGEGWVFASLLKTGVRGYGPEGGVTLRAAPQKGVDGAGFVPQETNVVVAGCKGRWMRVEYQGQVGWLAPADQCPSPVTTCP